MYYVASGLAEFNYYRGNFHVSTPLNNILRDVQWGFKVMAFYAPQVVMPGYSSSSGNY